MPTISLVIGLALLIPSIAVAVRRMHDVGKSGWYCLIPFYNLVLACTEGNSGTNQYGADPKGTGLDDEIDAIGRNKMIHWICVPAIFFSIIAMLHNIKLPFTLFNIQISVAVVVLVLALVYYFMLSKSLALGMFLIAVICLFVCHIFESFTNIKLWQLGLIIFVAAWVGQFYGHKIEGKKPSFFKDLQFLLIGPAWLLSFVYKKFGIKV
jgi:uncharacterized membrane protein YGL010W